MTRRDIILATELVEEDTENEETKENVESTEDTQNISVTVEQIDYTEYLTVITDGMEQMRMFVETSAAEQAEKTTIFREYVSTGVTVAIVGIGILIGVLAWKIVGRGIANDK